MIHFKPERKLYIEGCSDAGDSWCSICQSNRPTVLVSSQGGFLSDTAVCWECLWRVVLIQAKASEQGGELMQGQKVSILKEV